MPDHPHSVSVPFHLERRPAATASPRFRPTERYPQGVMIGLDVGSTTVKAVVIDPQHDTILWRDYQRHETRQAEKSLEFLLRIGQALPALPHSAIRLFLTGSGGTTLLPHIGGKFVQEVNAVSLAVEHLHPEVQGVIELGGQDAKIIIFKESESGKKKIPSMNDKCAGGTGAVIDKISAKLRIPPEQLGQMGYHGLALHPVAGKCGVFAETDINGLQKQGVPADELMASLFESIIQQNLSVLTRGHTLRPSVLLLGGPNTYIKGMRECWSHHLAQIWDERGVPLPDPSREPDEFIITPDDAQYFAAIGAVLFGQQEVSEHPDLGGYLGPQGLEHYLAHGRAAARGGGSSGLWRSREELARFLDEYHRPPWQSQRLAHGQTLRAFIGLDGGSTSTKGVLLNEKLEVVAKAYQLSCGNPIEDTIEIIDSLARQVDTQGATLEILGVGTTGYAKDTLKEVLQADSALVETVAHTKACLHFFPGSDVIIDVGGQDIKLITLKDGRVKDFKLNTQCSAGNGYFLQSTAQGFGFDIRNYADIAFSAESMPEFGYGCAVFLQSDIVDFQRKGWQANEIMAGLAAVLPKNIWLYVAQIPNLTKLGRRFVLQGGTQYNLAAVKAQVDFIRSRFRSSEQGCEVIVHPHCGESGAIGAALEAHRLYQEQGHRSSFIGLERVRQIRYITHRSEETRCHFCKNACLRTFIDVTTTLPSELPPPTLRDEGRTSRWASKIAVQPGHQRMIVATCEKGTVEDLDQMRQIKAGLDEVRERNPNFVALAAKAAFQSVTVESVADPLPDPQFFHFFGKRAMQQRRSAMERRRKVRIGIPRVLNLYSLAPFFIGWFSALGVPYKNLVFSDYTDQELYKRGAKRGSIDPCFPSKLGIPHVHDLVYRHHQRKPLTHIFFPMIDSIPSMLHGVLDSRACPTITATPEATHAAFIKEGEFFSEHNILFKKTFLNLAEPPLCADQLYRDWGTELGISRGESRRAVAAGLQALEAFYQGLRQRQYATLEMLERERRIGVVLLGRPYHNDPGINHEILEELQRQGYPILWQDALPLDSALMQRLFGEELRLGVLESPLSIDDVWKNSYSENTSRKLWAAKFTARHPNLVALELSSFKCGHDAPIYTAIEEIIESSGTPYFCFKDIDENKPSGSIKIRIETIAYFLYRYREQLYGGVGG